jgi:predicted permease
MLSAQPTTIVGVLPPQFDFDAIFSPGTDVDLVTPFPISAETARWGNTVFGIGRLKAGVSVTQAEEDLRSISLRFRDTINYPGTLGARVRPINDALRGSFRPAFLVLTAAVVCVLLIACVNLSNLLLGRTNSRRQEFAVRTALGAQKRHLIAQAMTESLLLAGAGAVVGIPLAVWATNILAGLETFGVPLLQDTAVDPTALVVTVGMTTAAGVLCGVLPAWYLTRSAGVEQATHQRSAGRGAALARSALVVAEVALACTLLVGAGLLIQSFSALLNVDLGFEPRNAIAWRVDPARPFESQGEANHYLDALVARVASLPGVDSVGLSDVLPLGRNRTWGVRAQDSPEQPATGVSAFPRMVDHGYLQAMQIPLVSGRYFDSRDTADAPRVVVINENLARTLWPDRDAVGRMITQSGGTMVVGVVENVRHGTLEEAGGNEMYFDYHQAGDWAGMEMVIRSLRSADSLAPEVRATIAAFDPGLPSGEYYELEALIDNAIAPRLLTTQLLGFFSALALTLAAVGLYGVIANSVVQRTQELGIRLAVGASRASVLTLILGGGLKLVAAGVVIGLAGAFLLSRLLESLLFGVTRYDPLAFGGNALLLTVVAIVACLVPAWRATRVNPITALRAD